MSLDSFPALKDHVLQLASAAAPGSDARTWKLSDPPDETVGDLSLACHGAAKSLGKNPKELAETIAAALAGDEAIAEASALNGFCNLRLAPQVIFAAAAPSLGERAHQYGRGTDTPGAPWLVEYCGPNTNKPLHIGHLRNCILGSSVARIADLYGRDVLHYNIINDRGIHICKSMVAYDRFGEGTTPQSTGEKGDHFVGRFYSLFASKAAEEFDRWTQGPGQEALAEYLKEHQESLATAADLKLRRRFLEERVKEGQKLTFKPKKVKPDRYPELMTKEGLDDAYQSWLTERQALLEETRQKEGVQRFLKVSARTFEAETSEIHAQSRDYLRRWEENDPEIRELWRTMNGWVLEGLNQTYQRLGIGFDHEDFESDTYLLGKDIVDQLLSKDMARRREDGAVVFDMPAKKQGEPPLEKVLLRADGTSVYITQDLGTLTRRLDRHSPDRLVYVVGSEQELHFELLFEVVDRLRPGTKEQCEHLSYGMVELPHGKMKSREGEIIEADEFLNDVRRAAEDQVRSRSPELEDAEVQHRAEVLAMAAVKYHLLKFSKRSTVKFDVESALDMTGKTGPYSLYALARIRSIQRKLEEAADPAKANPALLAPQEASLLLTVARLPEAVEVATQDLEPYHLADAVYKLAKAFNSYYTARDESGGTRFPVVQCEDGELRNTRATVLAMVAQALENGLRVLGIETLEQM